MLVGRRVPGRLRFISQAVRDIRDRLPEVIAGGPTTGRRIDASRLDQLQERWERLAPAQWRSGAVPTTADESVSLPTGLVRDIAELVLDHKTSRRKVRDRAHALFLTLAPAGQDHPGRAAAVSHWIAVTTWFEKRAHAPGRPQPHVSDDDILAKFMLFETTLAALLADFFPALGEVDDLVDKANS